MEKIELIQGEYKWFMKKCRRLGNLRVVCWITKGKEIVAHLLWHPAAKQIVFISHCSATKPLLDFIMPMLSKKTFYKMYNMQKVKNNDKELAGM